MILGALPFSDVYHSNEFDKLPLAKKTFDPNWLPHDWYLNLKSDYYESFNELLGPLVTWFGFSTGAMIGRVLVYVLFLLSLYLFYRTLKISLPIALIIIFSFFILQNQSLIAGEWILGGVESKTVAYAFVLLGLRAFIKKQYSIGFAWIGAALSAHILVGVYATFCLVFACLLTFRPGELKNLLPKTWPFFLTGLGGFPIIFHQFLTKTAVDRDEVGRLYVIYRHPHHLWPPAWNGWFWQLELALATLLFIWVYRRSLSQNLRFLAAYSLGGVTLFLIGLGFWQSGYIYLLRYYWFRFPDTIVPLLAFTLLGAIASQPDQIFSPNWFGRTAQTQQVLRRYRLVTLSVVTIILVVLTPQILHSRMHHGDATAETLRTEAKPVMDWIAKSTPKDAVFLADPALQSFYVDAQRARVVSFKNVPHSDADFLEWYDRIKRLNGGKPPEKIGFEAFQEMSKNFYRLDAQEVAEIAKRYQADYYLGRANHPMPFTAVHRQDGFVLYELPKP